MNFLRFADKYYSWLEVDQMIQAHFAERQIKKDMPDFFRLEFRLADMDVLDCFDKCPDPVKAFWLDRDGKKISAGLGHVLLYANKADAPSDVLLAVERFLEKAPDGVRFYGGFCFDPDSRALPWPSFGKQKFFLPRVELIQTESDRMLACHFISGEEVSVALSSLSHCLRALADTSTGGGEDIPSLVDRAVVPGNAEWTAQVAEILEAINRRLVKKVVLGRKVYLQFERKADGLTIMRRLTESRCQEFLFSFQFQPGEMLFGLSPERLFCRQDRSIETEAMAGTRRQGGCPSENVRLQDELLKSKKEHYEHLLVLQMLQTQMAELCGCFSADSSPQIIRTNGGFHLLSRVSGKLKDRITDHDIIRLLHPTPAVAGTPTPAAREMIRNLEPFNRGWFAGACGYLGRAESQFAVIIRSGLLSGRKLELFAGAGIVPGSDPLAEWAETENKLRCIEQVLGYEHSVVGKH